MCLVDFHFPVYFLKIIIGQDNSGYYDIKDALKCLASNTALILAKVSYLYCLIRTDKQTLSLILSDCYLGGT